MTRHGKCTSSNAGNVKKRITSNDPTPRPAAMRAARSAVVRTQSRTVVAVTLYMPQIENDLDLYSTLQTFSAETVDTETGELLLKDILCAYGAPLVAYVCEGRGYIAQSCCNHWSCPCCGVARARQEYGRIVYGCELLALNHKLYFWTLTCRGREIPLEVAEEMYYAWTNVLLTNARTKAKREAIYWAYVQVTERQKKTRAHPHSHIITTFLPHDVQVTADAMGKPVLVSKWFTRANETAGLGAQHKITEVASPQAVARYVAKYLFKDTMRDVFPPKWKRVRYSRNFPRREAIPLEFSVLLQSPRDWLTLERRAHWFECGTRAIFELAKRHCHVATAPIDTKSH